MMCPFHRKFLTILGGLLIISESWTSTSKSVYINYKGKPVVSRPWPPASAMSQPQVGKPGAAPNHRPQSPHILTPATIPLTESGIPGLNGSAPMSYVSSQSSAGSTQSQVISTQNNAEGAQTYLVEHLGQAHHNSSEDLQNTSEQVQVALSNAETIFSQQLDVINQLPLQDEVTSSAITTAEEQPFNVEEYLAQVSLMGNIGYNSGQEQTLAAPVDSSTVENPAEVPSYIPHSHANPTLPLSELPYQPTDSETQLPESLPAPPSPVLETGLEQSSASGDLVIQDSTSSVVQEQHFPNSESSQAASVVEENFADSDQIAEGPELVTIVDEVLPAVYHQVADVNTPEVVGSHAPDDNEHQSLPPLIATFQESHGAPNAALLPSDLLSVDGIHQTGAEIIATVVENAAPAAQLFGAELPLQNEQTPISSEFALTQLLNPSEIPETGESNSEESLQSYSVEGPVLSFNVGSSSSITNVVIEGESVVIHSSLPPDTSGVLTDVLSEFSPYIENPDTYLDTPAVSSSISVPVAPTNSVTGDALSAGPEHLALASHSTTGPSISLTEETLTDPAAPVSFPPVATEISDVITDASQPDGDGPVVIAALTYNIDAQPHTEPVSLPEASETQGQIQPVLITNPLISSEVSSASLSADGDTSTSLDSVHSEEGAEEFPPFNVEEYLAQASLYFSSPETLHPDTTNPSPAPSFQNDIASGANMQIDSESEMLYNAMFNTAGSNAFQAQQFQQVGGPAQNIAVQEESIADPVVSTVTADEQHSVVESADEFSAENPPLSQPGPNLLMVAPGAQIYSVPHAAQANMEAYAASLPNPNLVLATLSSKPEQGHRGKPRPVSHHHVPRPSTVGMAPVYTYAGGKLNTGDDGRYVGSVASFTSANLNDTFSTFLDTNKFPHNSFLHVLGNTMYNSYLPVPERNQNNPDTQSASIVTTQSQSAPLPLSSGVQALMDTSSGDSNDKPINYGYSASYQNYYFPSDSVRNATISIVNGNRFSTGSETYLSVEESLVPELELDANHDDISNAIEPLAALLQEKRATKNVEETDSIHLVKRNLPDSNVNHSKKDVRRPVCGSVKQLAEAQPAKDSPVDPNPSPPEEPLKKDGEPESVINKVAEIAATGVESNEKSTQQQSAPKPAVPPPPSTGPRGPPLPPAPPAPAPVNLPTLPGSLDSPLPTTFEVFMPEAPVPPLIFEPASPEKVSEMLQAVNVPQVASSSFPSSASPETAKAPPAKSPPRKPQASNPSKTKPSPQNLSKEVPGDTLQSEYVEEAVEHLESVEVPQQHSESKEVPQQHVGYKEVPLNHFDSAEVPHQETTNPHDFESTNNIDLSESTDISDTEDQRIKNLHRVESVPDSSAPTDTASRSPKPAPSYAEVGKARPPVPASSGASKPGPIIAPVNSEKVCPCANDGSPSKEQPSKTETVLPPHDESDVDEPPVRPSRPIKPKRPQRPPAATGKSKPKHKPFVKEAEKLLGGIEKQGKTEGEVGDTGYDLQSSSSYWSSVPLPLIGWEIPVPNWSRFTELFSGFFWKRLRTSSGAFTCDDAEDEFTILRSELDVDNLCEDDFGRGGLIDSNICNMFCNTNGFHSGVCMSQKSCLCYMTEVKNFGVKFDRLSNYNQTVVQKEVTNMTSIPEDASDSGCQNCRCLKSCQSSGKYIGYCSKSCNCGVPIHNEYVKGENRNGV